MRRAVLVFVALAVLAVASVLLVGARRETPLAFTLGVTPGATVANPGPGVEVCQDGVDVPQGGGFKAVTVPLDTFGRPDPNQDPPCERTSDTSVVQVLHLMNAKNLHNKVGAETGRAATLANSKKTSYEMVDEIYLLVYGRLPTTAERQVAVRLEKPQANRRKLIEDLLWALLNTPEFLFKD